MSKFNEILNSWTAADDFLADKIESMKTKVDSAIINYGFHINGNESNPSNAVTYLADAVNMRPAHMNFSTGVFDYGSWENAFFMPRPCMLKKDGTVDYYLNPNDYTKKTDGTSSDVANESYAGNAMMEWGRGGRKIWYKIVPDKGDPNSASIYISNEQIDNDFHAYSFINNKGKYTDHFYTAIYNGSLSTSPDTLRSISGKTVMQTNIASNEVSYATKNGDGWYTETYGDVELINILLILMGKSLNTQAVFGVGNMSGYVNDLAQNYGMINSGTMDTKGLFWGKNASSTSDRSGVKIFGMENYWGNQWRRIAGMILDDGHIKIKRCYGPDDNSTVLTYNLTGAGYVDTGITPGGTTGGFINKMNFTSGAMMPEIASGSESTYYADKMWYNNRGQFYAIRGGDCNIGSACGAFCMHLYNSAGISYWSIGSALSFRA